MLIFYSAFCRKGKKTAHRIYGTPFFIRLKLRFTRTAEHGLDFVGNHAFDSVSCGGQILSGVKVRRIFHKVLADSRGHGDADVGIDIDFANRHRRRFAQHILGNTDGVGHLAAVLVDGFHIVLVDGACAVEHNRETGQFFFDFFENVKAKLGFLTGFEFVSDVAVAYRDSKIIHGGSGEEILNLVGLG